MLDEQIEQRGMCNESVAKTAEPFGFEEHHGRLESYLTPNANSVSAATFLEPCECPGNVLGEAGCELLCEHAGVL